MSLTTETVLSALARVQFPGYSRDIVAAGAVRDLQIEAGVVRFRIEVAGGDPKLVSEIERLARESLQGVEGIRELVVARPGPAGSASLNVVGQRRSAASEGAVDQGLIPEVKATLAVASGKGGVGKSTVAVNLAVALAREGLSVGLLDADIYGPSIPLMMGCAGKQPELLPGGQRLVPFERYGVRFMSLGFLVDPDSAVIWRGPLVMKAVEQLLRDVDWGALDVLVLDLPPGTGDVQLTLSQRVSLTGALIVTTPQDVALADARKGVAMFRKVQVPVLGLIENMSYHVCSGCGHRDEIFGHGGGKSEANRLGIPFLGEVPLDSAIRDGGDRGRPAAAEGGDAVRAEPFLVLARALRGSLGSDATSGETGSIFERFRKVWNP